MGQGIRKCKGEKSYSEQGEEAAARQQLATNMLL